MSTRSKWLDWKPGTSDPAISEKKFWKTAGDEPTKTTKTIFGVFVASTPANSQNFLADPQPVVDETEGNTFRECKAASDETIQEPAQGQVDAAGRVLAACGVRLIGGVHGVDCIGMWSDMDGPEVRAAIAVFHPDGVPVRYLDGDGVPMQYNLRRVPGEPVPANVLAEMEACGR